MGNEIFLYFPLNENQMVARIPARENVEAGTNRKLILDNQKIHFFEFESEKAIV